MKKTYTIDDCMIDMVSARDINEMIYCMVSQKRGKKTLEMSSNALSGLESVLKMSKKRMERAIQHIDIVSTGELKRMV